MDISIEPLLNHSLMEEERLREETGRRCRFQIILRDDIFNKDSRIAIKYAFYNCENESGEKATIFNCNYADDECDIMDFSIEYPVRNLKKN